MKHKIFVSYKYHDTSVMNIGSRGTVRDYVTYLQERRNRYDINRAEEENMNLSCDADNTIKFHIKNRIWDSSITLIFISPNMVDYSQPKQYQWIPWEISYSLKVPKRKDRHSTSNALIAVVLPQNIRGHRFDYFLKTKYYVDNNKTSGKSPYTCLETYKTFQIIRNNMFNVKVPRKNINYQKDIYGNSIKLWNGNDQSYIEAVTWDDFLMNGPSTYYNRALRRQDNINDYIIQKEISKQ